MLLLLLLLLQFVRFSVSATAPDKLWDEYILQVQILRCTKIHKHVVWRLAFGFGIIFFCELCLLQRKEDNQAVIFVICPHNWAFMEACYQLSLGLQVDFSMEWRLLQWHSLTRDKENADPDYYHILYLAIMLLVMMMTMAFDKPNLANVAYL